METFSADIYFFVQEGFVYYLYFLGVYKRVGAGTVSVWIVFYSLKNDFVLYVRIL